MKNLSELPIFNGLTPSTISSLTKNLPEKNFRKGELIIKQGDKGLMAYLLLSGKVEVYYTSVEGEKTSIIFHQAPFVFGEVELWEEHPYLANVEAMEPCETLAISKKDYIQLLHSNHQVSVNMVRLLSNLLWRTGEDRRVRIFGSVDHLLANLFCSFAYLFGKKTSNGLIIERKINKKEIAEILGVARQSVIKSFASLENEGMIRIEGKDIVIPDLAALMKKARNL